MPVNLLLENDVIVGYLQLAMVDGLHGIHQMPGLLKRVIDEDRWRERTVRVIHQEARFERFEDFVTAGPPEGLGTTLDAVKRLCRDDLEAIDAIDRVTGNRQGERTDFVDNVNEVQTEQRPDGNGSQYAIRRLRKDRPDLHARVLAGELTPHRAMIEAGFRPPTVTIRLDCPDAIAATLRKHLSDDQLAALRAAL